MGLLDKLTNGDTTFGFGGAAPKPPTATNTPQTFFDGSSLALDGVTPAKYSDTAPEKQGGRV